MPLHRRSSNSSMYGSTTSLEGICIEIQSEEGDPEFNMRMPVQGEIIQTFDIADTPGGWHLVWLDEAFEYQGELQAHLMIAARWVGRQLRKDLTVPVNIRFVPNVTLVQKGAPDIEKLPFAARGNAVLV